MKCLYFTGCLQSITYPGKNCALGTSFASVNDLMSEKGSRKQTAKGNQWQVLMKKAVWVFLISIPWDSASNTEHVAITSSPTILYKLHQVRGEILPWYSLPLRLKCSLLLQKTQNPWCLFQGFGNSSTWASFEILVFLKLLFKRSKLDLLLHSYVPWLKALYNELSSGSYGSGIWKFSQSPFTSAKLTNRLHPGSRAVHTSPQRHGSWDCCSSHYP